MAFMFYGASLAAQNHQNVQDSVRIYFKQGKIDLVPTLRENQSALNRIQIRCVSLTQTLPISCERSS